jgi:uncharacterized protein
MSPTTVAKPWKNPFKAWNNKPTKKVKEEGDLISFLVPERTDCWRKTRHNFIVDTAPFYWYRVSGDFEIICRISGNLSHTYDKAGIMIREDSENWMLCGLEFFDSAIHGSVSVTRDYTDWSLVQLPENSEEHGIWFCVKRVGNNYETFYSTTGKVWEQTRQGIFSSKVNLQVGICAACPMGAPYRINFEGFRLKHL